MPDESNKPVYLVDAFSHPVLVRIEGRASFQNSSILREFVTAMVQQKKTKFALDFLRCTGMDSTFLGVLAGIAMQLRKIDPPGSVILCRISGRNLELVRNLGLHRLLLVDAQEQDLSFAGSLRPLLGENLKDEVSGARMVLDAHENLIAADPSNLGKFQDVISFLRNRVEQK